MASGHADLERKYREKSHKILKKSATWIVFGFGAIGSLVASYVLRWGSPWIGWTSLAIASIGVWWQYKLFSAVQVLAASRGASSDERAASESIVLGARQCISVAGNGGELPELDDGARKNLVENYGDQWLRSNEELVRAMLAFVDDFRMFAGSAGEGLRRYFQGDPRTTCLQNIFTCIEHLGVLEQPTLPLGEPNLAGFTASFGLARRWDERDRPSAAASMKADEMMELSKAGTAMILMVAISFAIGLREQQVAA